MFGDIEAQPSHNKSARSRRANKTYKGGSGKLGGGSCLLKRNDEYAQAFANGFTIIIDSVDDKENYSRGCFSPASSDSGEDDSFDCDDLLEETDDCSEQKLPVVKSVTFMDETDKIEKVEDNSKNGNISSSKKPTSASEKRAPTALKKNAKKTVTKASATKGKLGIQSRNKLGLKLKIETEKSHDFTPYMKSSSNKGKSLTNKARQQHSLSQQKIDSKKKSDIAKCKDKNILDTKVEIEKDDDKNGSNGDRPSSTGSTRSIIVAEADEKHSIDNVEVFTKSQNQVTCFADVHREKSLSASTQEEMSTLFSPDLAPAARQRKISVISIGSVLRDSRETLV